MSDALYLSLWYPNLRIESLPEKLAAVLGGFAAHGGESRVYSATVWPVGWSEPAVFQRVWGHGERGAEPKAAVEETLELLHDDYAYEFQIGWSLWVKETPEGRNAGPSTAIAGALSAQDDSRLGAARGDSAELKSAGEDARTTAGQPPQRRRPVVGDPGQETGGTGRWVREPRLVRVIGYGPLFEEGTYEQDGHVRIDFGSDGPFLAEGADLDGAGARHIEENVKQLVELTRAVEAGSGATARLLWSELGESLAERLALRLGVAN